MIEKICEKILKKMRKEMPEIDDDRAEIILYGLELIIGEIPKGIIVLVISYLIGIFEITLLSILIIGPYRYFSGGVHMKTHIGCIIYTLLLYCGTALAGKYIFMSENFKYLFGTFLFIFCILMVKLYAPADTENVPILRKKERKQKRICSYLILVIDILIAIFIDNRIVSNIILFGILFQTFTITRIAYDLTGNKYGYEIIEKEEKL